MSLQASKSALNLKKTLEVCRHWGTLRSWKLSLPSGCWELWQGLSKSYVDLWYQLLTIEHCCAQCCSCRAGSSCPAFSSENIQVHEPQIKTAELNREELETSGTSACPRLERLVWVLYGALVLAHYITWVMSFGKLYSGVSLSDDRIQQKRGKTHFSDYLNF